MAGRVNRFGGLGLGLGLALACTGEGRPDTKAASSSVIQSNATEPPPSASAAPPQAAEPTPPPVATSAPASTNPCLATPAIPAEPVASLDSATCVLRVARGLVRNVQVAVGDGVRRVHLVETAVEIAPSQHAPGVATVRSGGSVQLIGAAPIGALALRSPGDVVPGVVHAGTQAQLVEFRVHGSDLVGVVLLGNTRVEQVRVSCSSLTTLPRIPRMAVPLPIVGAQRWALEDDALLGASAASARTAVGVRAAPEMSKLEGRPGRLKLLARYDDGSWLRGWAEERLVRLIPKNEGRGGIGEGIGSCGGDLCGAGVRMAQGAQRGTARVAPGTAVLDRPHGQPWATIRHGVTVHAMTTSDAAWIQLQELTGIREHEDCALLEHAYVPALSVSFHAEADTDP